MRRLARQFKQMCDRTKSGPDSSQAFRLRRCAVITRDTEKCGFRNLGLPLARPTAHLGQLVDPKRHALIRPAGNGGRKWAAIVRRYAQLASAQMARHATLVDGLLRVTSAAQQVEEGDCRRNNKGVTITRNALI
jgi:hypothetical protein